MPVFPMPGGPYRIAGFWGLPCIQFSIHCFTRRFASSCPMTSSSFLGAYLSVNNILLPPEFFHVFFRLRGYDKGFLPQKRSVVLPFKPFIHEDDGETVALLADAAAGRLQCLDDARIEITVVPSLAEFVLVIIDECLHFQRHFVQCNTHDHRGPDLLIGIVDAFRQAAALHRAQDMPAGLETADER